MIKAIIFDFDGLIVDTETPDFISWKEVYRQHGAELAKEIWARIVGGDNGIHFDANEYLEELTGQPVNREAIWDKRRERYQEHLESQPVLPGVREYLQGAKDHGLKLAVASSSRRSWVEGHLKRLVLIDNFPVICTRDDVSNVKPDPELYLLTAKKLGVDPQEAIALEDSFNGLTAAKRAGLFVVVAPNYLTNHMDFSQADIKLESLADLSFTEMLAQANSRRFSPVSD